MPPAAMGVERVYPQTANWEGEEAVRKTRRRWIGMQRKGRRCGFRFHSYLTPPRTG